MDIFDSIQLSLSRYFDINSRADRREFWLFFLFYIGGTIASAMIDYMAGSFLYFRLLNVGIFSGVFIILITIPTITVMIRRLNDIKFSKLFILLLLVPLGNIALLILCAKRSKID